MHSAHLPVLLAAALLLHTPIARGDELATSTPASGEAAVLARLEALEKRVDDLAAENRSLRDQLAARNNSASTVAATAPAPAKSDKPARVYAAAAGKEEKLTIGGFVQVNSEFGDAPDARWTGIDDRFFVRRARLNAGGSFAEDFSFKLEGDFGNNSVGGRSGYSAQMTDGYITWTPSAAAGVRAGQFKTPFGYEQLMPDTKVQTVERSLANDRLTLSRQIGVGLFGDIVPERLAYSTGIFNGNGVNNGANDNDDFLYVGRIASTLLRRGADDSALQLDAAVNAFTMDTPGAVAQRDGFGLDLQFIWGPATVAGEWLRNDLTSSTGVESDSDGWAVFASWVVAKRWLILGRVESFDPSSLAGGDDTDSWTIGGAYLINGDNLKLTLNYMQGAIGGGESNGRMLGRLQLVY